jgi:magnesium chelatase subunit D
MVLGITRSVELAQKKLTALLTSGRTPLAQELDLAYEVIKAAQIKDKDMLPLSYWYLMAGYLQQQRGRRFFGGSEFRRRISCEEIKSIVIDTDRSFIKLHLAEKIAGSDESRSL